MQMCPGALLAEFTFAEEGWCWQINPQEGAAPKKEEFQVFIYCSAEAKLPQIQPIPLR